jgi:hypothetical protein
MKVEGPNGPRPGPAVRRAGKSGADSTGFAKLLEGGETESTSETPSIRTVTPVASVDALLAVQAIGDEEGRRHQARRRGEALLDELDEVRHGLLVGSLSQPRLEALVGLIQSERPGISDPALSEVLDEIDLRAQVELAKLQRAS